MRARPFLAALLPAGLLLAACGGGEAEVEEGLRVERRTADGLALPPSADAPRAAQSGFRPDTVRPEGVDPLLVGVDDTTPPAGRVHEAGDMDVNRIADDYRLVYSALFRAEGSSAKGAVDPAIESDAKRRIALDHGYEEPGAWGSLLADLDTDQRVLLVRRIADTNAGLAATLHRPGPPPAVEDEEEPD